MFVVFAVLTIWSANILSTNDKNSQEAVEAFKAYALFKMGKYEEAYSKFYSLAEVGNLQGILNIGIMLTDGLGVPKDSMQGLKWYRLAANKDNTTALKYIGSLYESGNIVAKSIVEAKIYYRKAAELGDEKSQYALGRIIYAEDKKQGLSWIKKAATNGDAIALKHLEQLKLDSPVLQEISLYEQSVITNAFDSIDRSARNKNNHGVIYFLSADSRIEVSFPGSKIQQLISKKELGLLWKRTFHAAKADYQFMRSSLELKEFGGKIIVHSNIIESYKDKSDKLIIFKIKELANLTIENEKIIINSLNLTMRRD